MTQPERQPAEVAEPIVGEEVSGARPIPEKPEGAPEAVEVGEADFIESVGFDDEAQAVYRDLPSVEKGFVGKLFERIKSSDVVSNIVDRHAVWRDRRLTERAQKNLDGLTASQRKETATADDLAKRAEGTKKELVEFGPLLKDLGIELGQEERVRVLEEAELFTKKAEAARGRAEQLEGRKQDLTFKKEGFESSVNAARGRLDGRLAAKQEIYTQSLETFRGQATDIDAELGEVRGLLKTNADQSRELRVIVGKMSPGALRELLEGRLAANEEKQKALEKEQTKLTKQREKPDGKIKELEERNADLQKRREAILPPKERKPEASEATKEEPAKKIGPLAIENRLDGSFLWVDYDDGLQRAMGGDGIYHQTIDGEFELEKPFDEIEDADFDEFVAGGFTKAELDRNHVPSNVVDRIETIRFAKKVGGIVSGWNYFVRGELGERTRLGIKPSGMEIKVEGDPSRALPDKNAQRDYLKTLLAKKVAKGNVGMLSHRTTGIIERFLDSRERIKADQTGV